VSKRKFSKPHRNSNPDQPIVQPVFSRYTDWAISSTSGLYGGCSNGVLPIQFFQAKHRIQFRSRPMRFLGFSNHVKGAPRQEISKWSTVCSTFSGNGWSVIRSASLATGGTWKKRPSLHLHKVPNRSNKLNPRTLQTALVKDVIKYVGFSVIMIDGCMQTSTSIHITLL
jgi:hypothetical protein